MGNSTPEDDWVVVKTTLPIFPANAERPTVSTERLILRPWRPDDVAELHVLRTQPEVMQFTSLGRVDVDLAETQTRLDPFLPPNDTLTHNCAICWKETGEVIGSGGCHRRAGTFGWPEVGYMLRKEYWGQGLATEFVRAFLEMYSLLARSEVELKVKQRSVPEGRERVDEVLTAITEASNFRSQRILLKCGIELNMAFEEPDLGDPTRIAKLKLFTFFPGRVVRTSM